jgi:hypothetical protein
LHKEDHAEQTVKAASSTGMIEELLQSFSQATGWAPIAVKDEVKARARTQAPAFITANRGWQLVSALPMDGMLDASDLESQPSVSENTAKKLWASIEKVIERLENAERTVWRQEAELASNIGVTMKVEDQEDLATSLDRSLEQAASAIGCDAAAIYLLDDATSVLKMRSCIGLPKSRLTREPRQLRGSLADLEALLGNAVLIEDIATNSSWQSPEDFGSALVVPIGSLQMPQGTLWLWSERKKSFNAQEIEIAKKTASEIMARLERKVLCQEVASARQVNRGLDEIVARQASLLPDLQPLDHRIDIAGITEVPDNVANHFHAWTLQNNGQIQAALGGSRVAGLDGSMVNTTLQTTLELLWKQPATAAQVIRQCNDHLWGLGEGDWRSTLTLIEINPSDGHGSICNAGRGISYLLSQRGFRPLSAASPLLATQPEAVFSTERFVLNHKDALLSFSPLPVKLMQHSAQSLNELVQYALKLLELPAKDALAELSKRWLELGLPYDLQRSILWISRVTPVSKPKRTPVATVVGSSPSKPRRGRKLK